MLQGVKMSSSPSTTTIASVDKNVTCTGVSVSDRATLLPFFFCEFFSLWNEGVSLVHRYNILTPQVGKDVVAMQRCRSSRQEGKGRRERSDEKF